MKLKAENSRLINKVNKLKNIVMTESTLKQEAEEITKQLTTILHTAKLKNQYLKRDIQK